MAKEGKGRFLTGAFILLVGSVVAKILGAVYRIPLTNILGAEGMGMYQLVFPVFALFMVLSSAGIPTALSRIVAEERAAGRSGKKYLVSAMIMLFALGSLFGVITLACSGQFAKWQGNEGIKSGFMIIAPTILIVSIVAGLRGWFQGEMYMVPTAVSAIIEQTVKLAVGLALSVVFIKKGVSNAVNGALLGVAASEVCALLYLAITFFVRNKRTKGERLLLQRIEAKGMFKVAFPIALVAILMPLSNFFDSVIIVNVLKGAGRDIAAATSEYGLLSGPVNSIINMPIVVIMALAIAIIPAVSASRTNYDINGVLIKSNLSIKLAYIVGIPSALFFMVFAPRFLPLLYPRLDKDQLSLTVNLLRIVSFNVVTLSVMQIYSSLLQAVDKTKYAVLSLSVAIVVKVVLNVVLTHYIGILGAGIASVAMGVTSFLGMAISYRKICGIHLEKNVGKNLISGVIMALVGIAVSSFISNDIVATAVGGVVCVLTYVWLVFLFGLLSKSELEFLPMRRALMSVYKAVRFWEKDDDVK